MLQFALNYIYINTSANSVVTAALAVVLVENEEGDDISSISRSSSEFQSMLLLPSEEELSSYIKTLIPNDTFIIGYNVIEKYTYSETKMTKIT